MFFFMMQGNQKTYPGVPYLIYEDFSLNEMNGDECKAEFRQHILSDNTFKAHFEEQI